MTIKIYLNKNKIFAKTLISKPLLTPRHVEHRLVAANQWLYYSEEEIKTIIFSDESKFNLRYSDGKTFVWLTSNSGLDSQYLNHTVKFGGGSVMVCGCFSYYGVRKLVFIDEIMDATAYVNIISGAIPD